MHIINTHCRPTYIHTRARTQTMYNIAITTTEGVTNSIHYQSTCHFKTELYKYPDTRTRHTNTYTRTRANTRTRTNTHTHTHTHTRKHPRARENTHTHTHTHTQIHTHTQTHTVTHGQPASQFW